MALPLLCVTVLLLVIVILLPDHISEGGGAKRWIRIGPFQFQPTEMAKFALCVYLAAWLMTRGDKLKSMTAGLIPFGMVIGVFCGIMYLQANVSSAVMLIIIGSAIYFAAGANLLHIGAGLAGGGVLGTLVVQTLGHTATRLKVWSDPWAYPRDGGWQPVHSLYALASGEVFGRGLGQGRQKFLWLPSAHADAIFSVIGEELGLIGTFTLVAAFLLLAYRSAVARSIRSTDGRWYYQLDHVPGLFEHGSCVVADSFYRPNAAVYLLWWYLLGDVFIRNGRAAQYFETCR
jgi:cell division protein FtsW